MSSTDAPAYPLRANTRAAASSSSSWVWALRSALLSRLRGRAVDCVSIAITITVAIAIRHPWRRQFMLDIVIAGGGPAGLNAALMLGRARRTVLLCDSGQPRNARVHAMHGFLSRDGADPAALRQTGRDQLGAYPTVRVRDVAVEAVAREAEQFTVTLGDGTTEQAHRLLLATGVADQLPPIPGLAELWGRGVFNCPYCDGWEVRDQPLAVLAADPRNLQLALQLTRYSPDVLLCSNGPADLDGDARRQLGCTLLDDDSVMVDDLGQTSVPGVFAAGDMARRPSMPLPGAQVIIAAAEGAIAAVAIDQHLLLQQLAA